MTYFGTRDYVAPQSVIEAPQVVDVVDDAEIEADVNEEEAEPQAKPKSETKPKPKSKTKPKAESLPDDGLASEEETPEEDE